VHTKFNARFTPKPPVAGDIMPEFLTALPIFNEESHLAEVLERVRSFSREILVVDDGSTDGTSRALDKIAGIRRITHARNQGYGAALRSAFEYAIEHQFDVLVTIDCDGQHEPRLIPEIVAAVTDDVDIVSGSRYLQRHAGDTPPPADRRQINFVITEMLNDRLGLTLTDAFCGFKAYRVSALRHLQITEPGYAMPLQFWPQAVAAGLRIKEYPVPLIYLEEERSFGGALDDAKFRLAHYREVFEREMAHLRFSWTVNAECRIT